jgi:hypothetical protein
MKRPWIAPLTALALLLAPPACSEDPERQDGDGGTSDSGTGDSGTGDSAPSTDAPGGDGPAAKQDGPAAEQDGPAAEQDGPAAKQDGPAAKQDSGTTITNPCPALPKPGGAVINVKPSQAPTLSGIVAGAKSGTTILLADGTYVMTGSESQRRLQFKTAGVTLRSASGSRDKVIIDGQYKTLEMIFIAASNVTIADLTLKRAVDHLIHVTGGASATIKNTRLHNLKLIDSGEQFVKVNATTTNHYADDGRLECSYLELTAAGRPNIETLGGTSCYTGGIDAHGAWGWKVRFNTFKGIYCTSGKLAEHAVHFWSGARDTLVERNTIVDCARGVGFGLVQSGKSRTYTPDPYPAVTGYIGHYDGIIRNNVIHASSAVQQYFDTGIELDQAYGAEVYHNTVVSKPTFTSIDYRFANTKATIRNNLTHKITQRDGAKGTVDHNLQSTPASYFVSAAGVDYHLKSSATNAINKGIVVTGAGLDLDGQAHTVGVPDLGAYEYKP